jgi:hypothetical protein
MCGKAQPFRAILYFSRGCAAGREAQPRISNRHPSERHSHSAQHCGKAASRIELPARAIVPAIDTPFGQEQNVRIMLSASQRYSAVPNVSNRALPDDRSPNQILHNTSGRTTNENRNNVGQTPFFTKTPFFTIVKTVKQRLVKVIPPAFRASFHRIIPVNSSAAASLQNEGLSEVVPASDRILFRERSGWCPFLRRLSRAR